MRSISFSLGASSAGGFLLAALVSGSAFSQAEPPDSASPPVVQGDRARLSVEAAGRLLVVGRVLALAPDTVTIELDELRRGSRVTTGFAVANIRRVEVSRGKSRGAWIAGVGALGAIGGVLVGLSGGDDVSRGTGDPVTGALIRGPSRGAGAAMGALVGAVVGAGLGAILAPERWRPASLDALRRDGGGGLR